jgi:hemerythrin-like domain-containing protein
MEFETQVCRRLHQEHEATYQLCNRLEQALAAQARPLAPLDPAWTNLLRDVRIAIQHEVSRHFEFEEQSLFPLVEAEGDGDLALLLGEEHTVIREVAKALIDRIQTALERDMNVEEWQVLRTAGLEFTERLVSHAQKEDVSLLPALDSMLLPDQDSELSSLYVGA